MPLQYDRHDRGMAVLGSIQQRKTSALFKLFDSNADGYWEGSDFEQFVDRMAQIRGWAPGSPERERVSAVYSQIWDGLQAADSTATGA